MSLNLTCIEKGWKPKLVTSGEAFLLIKSLKLELHCDDDTSVKTPLGQVLSDQWHVLNDKESVKKDYLKGISAVTSDQE